MADMKTATATTVTTTAPSPSPRGQLVVGGDVMPPQAMGSGQLAAGDGQWQEMGTSRRW